MKVLFFSIIVAHGVIRLLGFAKAFRLAEINQLTQVPPRRLGLRPANLNFHPTR